MDLRSIVTSSTGKLYSLRSKKVRKLKETVENKLKENKSS